VCSGRQQCLGPDRLAQLDKLRLLVVGQEDTLLRHLLAEYLVLGFEEFDLTDQLVSSATGKQKQQGLEDTAHRDKMPEIQG